MQGKTTTNVNLPSISKERLLEIGEMTHRIALNTLEIFNKTIRGVKIDIIKIRLHYVLGSLGTSEWGKDSPQTADFQIVFLPFFKEQPDPKLQVIARWELSRKNILVYIIDERAVESNKEVFIGNVELSEINTDTISAALFKAMEMGFRHWAEQLGRSNQWLDSVAEILGPLSTCQPES